MAPKARKRVEDGFMMSYFTLPTLLKTLLATILLLFARKIYMGYQAVHYVNHCWDTYTIDAFRSSGNFQVLSTLAEAVFIVCLSLFSFALGANVFRS